MTKSAGSPWQNPDLDPLSAMDPHERALFEKLSPKGREEALKLISADKKTQAMTAFHCIMQLCWEGKDTKINQEQFQDIITQTAQFLWIAATMETLQKISSEGPEELELNVTLMHVAGSNAGRANAQRVQNLMEMLKPTEGEAK